MKTIVKQATAILMTLALVLCASILPVYAQDVVTLEDSTEVVSSDTSVQPLATLPSSTIVGSGQGTITNGYGTITVQLNSTNQTVKQIWILGNKNGGGANTSASFLSTATPLGVSNIAINGEWQQIYSGNMVVTNGSILFSITVADTSTAYNIAIVCY